jgi:protein-S-isoprenylcysteine O-methyltransferase Ste14
MGRDLVGRISGSVLFLSFLLFHLHSFSNEWNHIDLVARINGLLITGTIVLFLSAYFLRAKAVLHANGFLETVYPLICACLPLVIYHDVKILFIVPYHRSYNDILNAWFGLYEHRWLTWNAISMALVLTGNTVTLVGILYLKRSFSIMAEARPPVYTGIYQYIRHPLYLGEILATAGVLVFRFSNINIMLTFLFIIMQVARSRIEERKLMAAFPDYRDYLEKVGAFLPKSPHPQ